MPPQPLADTSPSCPKCRELGPIDVDEKARVRVERLSSREAVLQALGGAWPSSSFTHAIRMEGMKAHYATKRDRLKCAIDEQSHTPHFEGYIVETACGKLLNVGIDCAARWIFGIRSIEKAVLETLKYDRNVRTIENDPLELQLAMNELERAVSSLKSGKQALVNHASAVSKRMREAADTPRRRSVTLISKVETEKGTETLETTRELRGWELWTDAPSLLPLQERLTEIREEIGVERGTDAALNAEHERLSNRLRYLRRDLRPVEEWLERASGFFSEENLRLAVVATKQQQDETPPGDGPRPQFQVEGRLLIVKETGQQPIRLGAGGVA